MRIFCTKDQSTDPIGLPEDHVVFGQCSAAILKTSKGTSLKSGCRRKELCLFKSRVSKEGSRTDRFYRFWENNSSQTIEIKSTRSNGRDSTRNLN